MSAGGASGENGHALERQNDPFFDLLEDGDHDETIDTAILNEELQRATRIYGQNVDARLSTGATASGSQAQNNKRNTTTNSKVLPVLNRRRSAVLRTAGTSAVLGKKSVPMGVTDVPESSQQKAGDAGSTDLPSSFPPLDMRKFLQNHFLRGLDTEMDRRGAARLLGIPSELRTDEEIAALASSLASVSFFKNTSEKFRRDISRLATLLEVDKHCVVLEALEEPANLFVVLWGCVGNVHLGIIPEHKLRKPSQPSNAAGSKPLYQPNWTPIFLPGELVPGQCFGEIVTPQIVEQEEQDDAKTSNSDVVATTIIIPGLSTRQTLTPSTLVKVTKAHTGLLFISRTAYEELLRQEVTEDMKQKFIFCRDVCPLMVADGSRERFSVRKLFAMAKALERVEVERHTPVFLQGEESTDIYFVGEGRLQIVQAVPVLGNSDENGGVPHFELVDLGEVEKGWYFGEYAGFTGNPRSASVYALTPCTLYKISREALLTIFPPFVVHAMRDFMERAYLSMEEVVDQVKKLQEWKQFKQSLVTKMRTRQKAKHAQKQYR